MTDTRQSKTHEAVTSGGSALGRYQRVIVGRRGWGRLVYFELCSWLGVVPGALGVLLRRWCWPRLFGSCGRGVLFGANVALRHPHRIVLGDRVVLGEGCVLDARTEDATVALSIGDDTILGNNVMVSCKSGRARIGARCGLGAQTIVHAVANADTELGDDLIIGPRCYIAGGGNYVIDSLDVPMSQQGLRPGETTRLEDDIWLGAGVIVLPGVTVGRGSVAAAGTVVHESVPERSICAGVPARVVRTRGE